MENFYYDALNEFVRSPFYSNEHTTNEFHFPVLFGDDGAFTDSHYNFKYIDKMIEKFDEYSLSTFGVDIKLRYSTMDEFLAEVLNMNHTFPVYRGDFLPEIEDPTRWGQDKD